MTRRPRGRRNFAGTDERVRSYRYVHDQTATYGARGLAPTSAGQLLRSYVCARDVEALQKLRPSTPAHQRRLRQMMLIDDDGLITALGLAMVARFRA